MRNSEWEQKLTFQITSENFTLAAHARVVLTSQYAQLKALGKEHEILAAIDRIDKALANLERTLTMMDDSEVPDMRPQIDLPEEK